MKSKKHARDPAAAGVMMLNVADANERLTEAFFEANAYQWYQAACGAIPWVAPLSRLVEALGIFGAQIIGMDKLAGCVMYSYDAGFSPEAGFDYLSTYHRIDPRMAYGMSSLKVGEWFDCRDHFDDAYVAQSPFYQEFLIPYGGRYVFASRVIDDGSATVFVSYLSKEPMPEEVLEFARRITPHITNALNVQQHLRKTAERALIGYELLSRMRQPIFLVDADRNVVFSNPAAQEILDEGVILRQQSNKLVFREARVSLDFAISMRNMALVQFHTEAPVSERNDRRSIKLKIKESGEVAVMTLIAMRPEATNGAFGSAPLALATIYEPGRIAEPDPFLLAATFNLTPAEARVAARLCAGDALKHIAKENKLSLNTVRTQLRSVFEKTGTNRQADLVRLLITAAMF